MYHVWYAITVGKQPAPPKLDSRLKGLRGRGKRVPAVFYRTEAGGEPVREWLKALSPDDRKRIGEDIKTVEFGWPVECPFANP